MYDPTIGKFLSEDPLGFDAGDPNLTRYVGNSSPNYTDPTGWERLPWEHGIKPDGRFRGPDDPTALGAFLGALYVKPKVVPHVYEEYYYVKSQVFDKSAAFQKEANSELTGTHQPKIAEHVRKRIHLTNQRRGKAQIKLRGRIPREGVRLSTDGNLFAWAMNANYLIEIEHRLTYSWDVQKKLISIEGESTYLWHDKVHWKNYLEWSDHGKPPLEGLKTQFSNPFGGIWAIVENELDVTCDLLLDRQYYLTIEYTKQWTKRFVHFDL